MESATCDLESICSLSRNPEQCMGKGVHVQPNAKVQKIEGRSEMRKTKILVTLFELNTSSEVNPIVVLCNNLKQ